MTAPDALASAWMVNADDLRVTLDGLRAGLSKSSAILLESVPETLLNDTSRLVASLWEILERLETLDSQRGEAPSVGSPFGDPDRAVKLRDIIERLQLAWTTRLRSFLSEPHRVALQSLLTMDAPDLLGILGKGSYENSHSDVLRWLLDPRTAPSIAPAAIARLVNWFEDAPRWREALMRTIAAGVISVRREFEIGREWTGEGELDRIDILISGLGFVIGIENKIWAEEHAGQTETYWRWLETVPGLRAGVFLTPAGGACACPSFRSLSYLDLLGCLLEAPSEGAEMTSEERIVLASYIRSVAQHVLRTELRALSRA